MTHEELYKANCVTCSGFSMDSLVGLAVRCQDWVHQDVVGARAIGAIPLVAHISPHETYDNGNVHITVLYYAANGYAANGYGLMTHGYTIPLELWLIFCKAHNNNKSKLASFVERRKNV